MLRSRLNPPCNTNQRDMLQYKELDTCLRVFLRRITIAPPLTAPYNGQHRVVARCGRVFKVMIKNKVETVTADRVKPVPETDYTKQHKATTTSKPTDSKPPAKTNVPRMAAVGAHSTTTPKPSRIRVDTKQICTHGLRYRQRKRFKCPISDPTQPGNSRSS